MFLKIKAKASFDKSIVGEKRERERVYFEVVCSSCK